jgi:hypothetical protein
MYSALTPQADFLDSAHSKSPGNIGISDSCLAVLPTVVAAGSTCMMAAEIIALAFNMNFSPI